MRTFTVVATSLLFPALLLLASCQAERSGVHPSERVSVDEQALQPEDASYAALFRYRASSDALEVVDVSSLGHVVVGDPLPVPPNGTFRLQYRATALDPTGRKLELPLPETIQDARFSPNARSLIVLDRHDALSVIDLASEGITAIDTQVFPGFALSSDGNQIAYAKGDAPMLDAYVYDLRTGTARRLTSAQRPTWGFAFSPDDRSIAFVYSPFGFPSIYTVGVDGGEPHAMTNVGITLDDVRAGAALTPIPDGRKPPTWVNGVLVFENGDGAFGLSSDGRVVWERPGATRLFRGGEDVVHYHIDGAEHAARMTVSP